MSGGHFDYACYRTMEFADRLRNEIAEQGNDVSGFGFTKPELRDDVELKMIEIADITTYAASLMKEAEWFFSGDTSEDTFIKRVLEIETSNKNANFEVLNESKN